MKVGRHVKYQIYQKNQENTTLAEIDASSWYCDGKSDNPKELTAIDKAQWVAY